MNHLHQYKLEPMSEPLNDISSFVDVNPYEVLNIDVQSVSKSDISPDMIKKSYRKLALKVHPDKAKNEIEREKFHKKFQLVSFAYGVLIDPIRKSRFDNTGSLDDIQFDSDDESGLDFQEFLSSLFSSRFEDITEDMIENDKKLYRKREEYKDLITSYNKHKGDFELIYEEILHTKDDTDEDFMRFITTIQEDIQKGKIKKYKEFNNWKAAHDKIFGFTSDPEGIYEIKNISTNTTGKKTHITRKNKKKTRQEREAQEAEELAIQLGLKSASIKKDGTEKGEKDTSSLQALIMNSRKKNMFDLVESIEKKYGGKDSNKRNRGLGIDKKYDEPTEDEFLKIQQQLQDRKKQKRK